MMARAEGVINEILAARSLCGARSARICCSLGACWAHIRGPAGPERPRDVRRFPSSSHLRRSCSGPIWCDLQSRLQERPASLTL
jgi:hypothetical protein